MVMVVMVVMVGCHSNVKVHILAIDLTLFIPTYEYSSDFRYT